jgi:hypothetical protein
MESPSCRYKVWLERLRTMSDLNPLRTRENMCLENSERIRILLTHWFNLGDFDGYNVKGLKGEIMTFQESINLKK